MATYETSATVGEQGRVQVAGAPFAAGTQVNVTISPKRRPAEEFGEAWQRFCEELRSRPALKNISEDEIRAEIDRHRAGQ